ncbi:multidrug ABC transporter ATP-binding protein [Roseibium aquae]|uniref:Multidrug ABC transporter ATP-binding protein n=1 Tax=Roseibium aquae TaxID=1323746 RepID=A0A916WW88_9HYPH|nr:ABC transporter ATP-binding protein [Roseibium aquae]GGB34833.1 multidrug ABC transporter ATP-binding protein [Roseibium aquae]
MRPVFELFEKWIDPFREPLDTAPPRGGLAFLMYFILQVRWPFVLMLVLGGLTAIVEVAIYSFIGQIVDMLEQGTRDTLFETHGPTLLGMAFVVLVLRAGVAILTALVEEQTVVPGFFNLVRWQSHQQVMRQSLSYFHDDFSGRISQKVWQAGQSAGDFMVTLLQVVWYIVIYAISTLVLVGDLDWRLGMLVAVWIAGFCIVARIFVPRVRQRAKDVAHAGSGVSGQLVDTYANIQTVKLFGSVPRENEGVRANFEIFLSEIRRFTRVLTSVRAVMALLNGTMLVAIAAAALVSWQQGLISTGHVALTLGLILRLNLLLGRLLGLLNTLFRSFGTLQDSMDMIVRPVVLRDADEASELKVSRGKIQFQSVCFHYGKSGGVINGLDLTILPGERVGIVGPSGAGKSTLLNLLLRFYDPEAGRILIDGTDIAHVTQQSLRHQIGMVTQDVSLLHRSVRDNILYGSPDASEERLMDAARRARILDFIPALEDRKGRRGFDAHVGERGVKLSGGQRQRIAIARVLLKNAPILVLDEATSALDSEVEAAIQDSLHGLMQGKTVIVIAHRLSTIAELDRLVVMEEGRIVETGTHDRLLEQGGLYAQLWLRQSGGFLSTGQLTR